MDSLPRLHTPGQYNGFIKLIRRKDFSDDEDETDCITYQKMLRQIGNAFLKISTKARMPAAAVAAPLADFSTWTKKTEDSSSSLTETQHSLWSSFLQTGNGSADLFGSINQKSDGHLSKA